jgi:putative transcriptional regulator
MSADFASTQLSHHFLIAMPGLEDPTFAKSVVYLCEHSERGAMGLIINKPGELSLKHLFDKVELPLTSRRPIAIQCIAWRPSSNRARLCIARACVGS